MRIDLDTLFTYRQYTDGIVYYYFDKKTYTIVTKDQAKKLTSENYIRCIPMFQIDETKIQKDYIDSLHNKKIESEYNHYKENFDNFNHFIHNRLENDYWKFYCIEVKKLAIAWCEKNNIKYIDTSKE